MSTELGTIYQARYSPSARSLCPRISWTMIAPIIEMTSEAISTPDTASVLGTI